jgi:predicted nucleic acid-binding protein
MLLYLDICCFNRPFDPQDQTRVRWETEAKLEVQERIRSGGVALAWSYAMDLENHANPFAERRHSIARWRDLATADATASSSLLDLATDLEARGLKPLDSLHLACAITCRCDFLLTTDDGILRKRRVVGEIRILNPTEFILLP